MIANLLYNALLPLGLAGVRAAALGNAKVREAIAGRRGYAARWEDLRARLDARPVWFHVASVGEFEQARPVITALARTRPGIPVMLTFSSPSGLHFARRREAAGTGPLISFVDYLPADTRGRMDFCLDCANPRLLVFVKFDLWPNLIRRTYQRGVPMVMIDATLSPSSHRLSAAGRWFYRPLYLALDKILAISTDDAARFALSAPAHPCVRVAGDTRFDRVMERWNERGATGFDVERDADTRVVIAGSTWPLDEANLLPALARLLGERANVVAVLAPHEPGAERVQELRDWARAAGLSVRLASEPPGPARVVIIDSVGVLADAYRLADVAYVGGSFSTGVHSVIEPAIAGLPVLFGPVHDNSFEALQLHARGGGFPVADAGQIHARLAALLEREEDRRRAGESARAYVTSQLGATAKCVAEIEEFL
ncbi:MAG: hypothetical protein OEO21_07690 [Candidatus Krumholzibacteria bacterium]|nr:hypothetical protein [Candidatus Krumholzibacteria bacterium]